MCFLYEEWIFGKQFSEHVMFSNEIVGTNLTKYKLHGSVSWKLKSSHEMHSRKHKKWNDKNFFLIFNFHYHVPLCGIKLGQPDKEIQASQLAANTWANAYPWKYFWTVRVDSCSGFIFSLSPFLPVYLKDRDRDLWLACSHMLSTARVGLGCSSEAWTSLGARELSVERQDLDLQEIGSEIEELGLEPRCFNKACQALC